MIAAQFEIIVIACITAAACAIPGTFLVLRRMSMLSDAISHSILLGIVVAFFFVKQIDSPFIVLAAGLSGLITVLVVESLIKTNLLKEDASIGVVYPFMFSVAVVLISLFASQVHIDTDAVLMGELAFAPLNRLVINGVVRGPVAFYQIGGMLILNIIMLLLFYKELKLSVFDEEFAKTLGFRLKWVTYGLMAMVSFTAVVAFEVAGAIMMVGYIVGPAVVGSYFTKRLWQLLILAPLVGVMASILGYSFAHSFDVSIAGSIVMMLGVLFIFAFLFAPKKGYIAELIHRKKFSQDLSITLLLVHILQHECEGNMSESNNIDVTAIYFGWSKEYIDAVVKKASNQGYMELVSDILIIKDKGKLRAGQALER